MTQRERQLLEWIRENPMISQQELADKAGITRSSVAVHISNLMKKGCITGKGYIVRTDPYVAVVGGVNMDIGAVSAGALVARDSNPGHVTTSLGGVGRNIAHNLCLLGQRTAMVTVMGDDDFGRRVQENAKDIGLDLSAGAVLPDCRTGTYLYICGPDGDMALAVNDMAIYDRMTPDFLRQRLDFINGADLVVLETNLPEESIRWLCDNCKAPILADPVSTIKAEKLRPVLGKLAALKPNRLEAELLSGMSIRTREDAAQAARKLLDTGLGKCRMCVAAPADYQDDPSRPVRVATKFVNVAKSYYASMGRDIDIIKLNGSIELAPILGLSDVIVDIVETGTTLRENGLRVVTEFMPISARFIANKASYQFKHREMDEMLEKLRAALAAKEEKK